MASAIQQKLKYLQFPGKAGQLQADGDMSGLVQELASDYSGYHDYLSGYLNELGTEPDPEDFRDDYPGYCVAVSKVMEVYYAEVLLRQSLAYVTTGRSFDDPDPDRPPIGDAHQRIISVLTGQAVPSAGAGVPLREQVSCPFPTG